MKDENLKIIYNEVVELHKYQQQSIDLMYNKFNWILVADSVFLAALYNTRHANILVILLVAISAVLSLLSFVPTKYKYTAKISDQLTNVDNNKFLESLIKKKKEAFTKNESHMTNMGNLLICSQLLLVFAILCQFLMLIIKYI